MVVGRMAARGVEAKTGERRSPRCPGRAPRAGSGIAGPLPSSPCRALVPAAPAPPESFSKIVLASPGEFPYSTSSHGGVAQLGERLTGSQEVRGSIPLVSTIVNAKAFGIPKAFFMLKFLGAYTLTHTNKKLPNLFPNSVHSLLAKLDYQCSSPFHLSFRNAPNYCQHPNNLRLREQHPKTTP